MRTPERPFRLIFPGTALALALLGLAPVAVAQDGEDSEASDEAPAAAPASGESADDIRKSLLGGDEDPSKTDTPAEEPKPDEKRAPVEEEKPAEERSPKDTEEKPAEPEAKPAEAPVEEIKPGPIGGTPEAAPAAAVAPPDMGRERVHAVVVRPDHSGGKHEVGIAGTLQFATKFTQHGGAGLRYGYHFSEHLALVAGFDWYFDRRWTDFSEKDLNGQSNREPKPGPATLMQWNAFAGAEVAPVYGKFSFFDWRVVHFHFFANAGLGLAETWIQLIPALIDSPVPGGRTFGQTGYNPTGQFAAGFRFYAGDFVTLRFEVRDTFFASQPQTIYGCNMRDLSNLAAAPATCRKEEFNARDAFGNPRHLDDDAGRAQSMLRDPSSGVVNLLQFNASVSFRF